MICVEVTSMKLSIALILYELRKRVAPPEIISIESSIDHEGLTGLRIMCEEDYEEDILYISTSEEVRRFERLPRHLLISGIPDLKDLSGAVFVGLEQSVLINAVEQMFYRYNQIENDLIAAIYKNETLKTVLSICARFFNNPITLSDLRMRFIDTSDNIVRERMPDYFKVVLDTGYVDARLMNAMKKRGYDRLVNSSKDTILFELEEIPVRYFHKNIYENGRITACLLVHEAFSPIDIAQTILVEQVWQVVDNYAFKNPRGQQPSVNKVEQMARALLDGEKYNEDIHSLYLKHMNWNGDSGFFIIIIQVNPENVAMNTAQYTFATAQRFFPGSLIVENKDYAVIIICDAQIQYDWQNALSSLDKHMAERNDKAAVSHKFENFGTIKDQYRVLTMAMQLGMLIDPGAGLYHFDDYSLPVMLKICSRDFDLRIFCVHEAILLYEYDKANDSEFFKSMYTYLKHNRSLASAASELKIHRNTLLYRIRRAAEISGIDPSGTDIVLPILLSYEILHYRLKIE